MATSILLADDHTMFRSAIRAAIDGRDDFEVIEEVADGHDVVEAVRRLRPSLVAMDLWLPGLSGIEATREILREDGSTRVLMLSVEERRSCVQDALRAGAMGYLVKTAPLSELFEGLHAVARGQCFVSSSVAEHVVGALRFPQDAAESGPTSLTHREREVLGLIAEGLGSPEIAARLHVSRCTVDTHRANLMRKLEVHKTSTLMRVAIREGLVQP